MKKKRLDIEFSFDFDLHGIITSCRSHKLAWEINQSLNINLVRQEDFAVNYKESVAHYVLFAFDSEVNHLKLLRNRPQEETGIKNLLVPEHPRFDFFLLSQGEDTLTSNRLQEVLRNIPSVELVAFIPLTALKSKENFIF
jgi:hypothetical protein